MATLNEISYSILSQCYNFDISDDIDVDLDWIYYQIATIRNKILNQEIYNIEQRTDIYKYQDRINCVPVECVDIAECCDITVDCNIRKVVLPTRILLPDYATVQTVDRKIYFEYADPFLINYYMQRRLRVTLGYWYNEKNNLYLVTDLPNIEVISLYGIFEDPSKLSKIKSCKNLPCYDVNENEYSIEAKHIPFVEQYVVSLIRNSLTNVKDLSNNALDDAINTIRGDMETLSNQLNSIGQKTK